MVSAMIVNPPFGQTIEPDTTFDIDVQLANLVAGSFTNPQNTYYAAPQQLQGGSVVGHCHVTVQDIGSLNPTTPPDAKVFAFFKGIDDAGNGQGLLSATVDGGLPAGTYRICTMNSAQNHQPVLMPVAQRGSQDDCIRVTVAAGGGNSNNNNNNDDDDDDDDDDGQNNNNDAQNNNNAQGNTADTGNAQGNTQANGQTTAQVNGQTNDQANGQTQNGGSNRGNNRGSGRDRHRFQARDFVV